MAASAVIDKDSKPDSSSGLPPGVVTDFGPSSATEASAVFAEDGDIGDEFISLTFHESEDEEGTSDESDTADDDEEEAPGDEDENDSEEGESSS